jgi:hypothetical protein
LKLTFRGHPSAQQVAAFADRGIATADRERASYIAAMGISAELNDLIRTVKFESMHLLTRPELYRFGIDTRVLVQTAWNLESAARPYVRKAALARKEDGVSFRIMEWRLFCENKDRARLMFVREFDKNAAGKSSVIMMAGFEKPVDFGTFPARSGSFEAWSGTIASGAMKTVLAANHLQMAEGVLMPDGKLNQETFEIDTSGLEPAWTKLLASCPTAPKNAKPLIAWPPASSTTTTSTTTAQ